MSRSETADAASSTRPLRAAVYARISRDLTGERAGVARQEEDCRALAESKGMRVVAVFTDNDISAFSGSPRPGYRALLAAIQAGDVEAVVVWHTDRLYRRTYDLEEYISLCQPRNVPTLAVQSGPLDLTTPSGRMIARQLGAVAQYESEQKAERQRRANLQRALQGRHFSSLRVFAYEPDGLTLRNEEAFAVLGAYRDLLAGVSLTAICRQWNEQGFRTSKKGNLWDPVVLRQVLRSPRYAGLRVYHGAVLTGQDGAPVRGEWPPVVDEETWHAVQAMLDDPRRRRQYSSKQLLSGIARCAVCDAVIQSGGSRKGRRRYRCSAKGGHAYREAEPIDAFVSNIILAYLRRPGIIEELAPPPPEDGVRRVRDELAALRQRSDGLVAAYADGAITLQQLQEGQSRLARRRADLEAHLPQGRASAARRLAAATVDPAELWEQLDLDEKRQVIDDLLIVRVRPAGTKEATYLDWRNRVLNPSSLHLEWRHRRNTNVSEG